MQLLRDNLTVSCRSALGTNTLVFEGIGKIASATGFDTNLGGLPIGPLAYLLTTATTLVASQHTLYYQTVLTLYVYYNIIVTSLSATCLMQLWTADQKEEQEDS